MSGAGVPPEVVPYERYGVPLSAHLTDPLLRLAPPVVGGCALDVACGTGLVARRRPLAGDGRGRAGARRRGRLAGRRLCGDGRAAPGARPRERRRGVLP